MKKRFGVSGLMMFALLGGCTVDSASTDPLAGDDAASSDAIAGKEEESEQSDAWREEPSDDESVGQQSQALLGDYWVGIMMAGSTCPAGMSKVSFYLDMEDNDIDSGSFTGWMDGYDSYYTERSATWADGKDLRGGGYRFNWCRVDGEKFKPLTKDALDYEQFYSVLKLSANCPPGSHERGIYIDTEDDDPNNSFSGSISPNVVNANASLKFCQFTYGNSTMSSFPNFKDSAGAAVQYSVLHEFDDATPPKWVINKKYIWFDDEDDDCQSHYLQKPSPGIQLVSDPYNTFTSAVQRDNYKGDWGTWFDFAQVK